MEKTTWLQSTFTDKNDLFLSFFVHQSFSGRVSKLDEVLEIPLSPIRG
jgi:hypothetical protein